MKKLLILMLALGAMACENGGDENIIEAKQIVENFDDFVVDDMYLYGYENDAVKFEHFLNEEYGYWGGFVQSKVCDANPENGIYANQYAAYNSTAASGNGFLLYYYDSYNEPCDIIFKGDSSKISLTSVKLNLTTYTYASITNEDINTIARAFDEGDYLKVIFQLVDATGNTIGTGAECYVVDYRDGKRFVADNWQEFFLHGRVLASDRVRVTIETSDVGEWGANTPLYICMDDLTYTVIEN